MAVALVPSLLLGMYGIVAIVRTGGDWMDWAWAITGVVGVASVVVGETLRYRWDKRRREALRAEYRRNLAALGSRPGDGEG